MKTWALILMVFGWTTGTGGGGGATGNVIATLPGFTEELLCDKAAAKAKEESISPNMKAFCVVHTTK